MLDTDMAESVRAVMGAHGEHLDFRYAVEGVVIGLADHRPGDAKFLA